VVALVTDAFGGFGGIAQYNRDFLTALAESPRVRRVVAIPRSMQAPAEGVPGAVDYRAEAAGSLRRFALACSRSLLNDRPQLILCGHVNLLPFGVPLALRHRVPLALVVYGIDVWQPPRLASRLLLRRVDHYVSISRLTVDKMLTWTDLPDRVPLSIVPNAVDLQRFAPSTQKPRELLDRYRLHGNRVIMTLGRFMAMERYKGVREVLDSLPDLIARDPTIRYLVVGDGSDLPSMREHAESLKVTDHVIFAGRINEAEKVAHYQLADAYVMPGRGEGFGFVFLEAMACGVPVVASVLDGSREAVRFGALGELCDPREPATIVTAIMRALAKGRGMPPEGLDYFSMPNFRDRVHQFADAVMSGEASPRFRKPSPLRAPPVYR
jgi:phosphatidylinositol alpha-1,6-mannosyltransferase